MREEGYAGPITLVGDEPHHPYERPPLSKGYLQGTADRASLVVHPEDWYADHDVELRLGVAGDRDRPATRSAVGLADGEPIALRPAAAGHRLRAATGCGCPARTSAGVHYLRRIEDSDRIAAAFARVAAGRHHRRRLDRAGDGRRGARAAGLDVTVLEQAALPLLGVLGPELAAVFADLHRDNGVRLRCDVQVTEIVGADGHRDRRAAGRRASCIPADVVLVGVGITPNTELARAAGLLVANGIVVDEHLRTADPAIFAAGDVANAHHPFLRRHIRVEHWANAHHQPAVGRASMLGQAGELRPAALLLHRPVRPRAWSTPATSRPDAVDQVVVRGDLDKREFIAFWLHGGRVLAGMNVNVWDVDRRRSSALVTSAGPGRPGPAGRPRRAAGVDLIG